MNNRKNILFLITLLLAMPTVHCANDTQPKKKSFVATLIEKAKKNSLKLVGGVIIAGTIIYYFLNKNTKKNPTEAEVIRRARLQGEAIRRARLERHARLEREADPHRTPLEIEAEREAYRRSQEEYDRQRAEDDRQARERHQRECIGRCQMVEEEIQNIDSGRTPSPYITRPKLQRELATLLRMTNQMERYNELMQQLIPRSPEEVQNLIQERNEGERFLTSRAHQPDCAHVEWDRPWLQLSTIYRLLEAVETIDTYSEESNHLYRRYEILNAFNIFDERIPRPLGYRYRGFDFYRDTENLSSLQATNTPEDIIIRARNYGNEHLRNYRESLRNDRERYGY